MADNFQVRPGTGGDPILRLIKSASTEVYTQVMKLCLGGQDSEALLTIGEKTKAASMPVAIASDQLNLLASQSTLEALLAAMNGLRAFTLFRTEIANNISTAAIAANTSRKTGSYLVNNTNAPFYLNFGAAAVFGQGAFLLPKQVFLFNTTQEIRVIQQSGGSLFIDGVEAT